MTVDEREKIAGTAERIECDACLDWVAAAPDRLRDRLGLSSTTIGGMGLLGCTALPITELNRAMAVGVEGEPSREDLDAAVDWLDTHGVNWSLQVAPPAHKGALQAYLEGAGLAPAGPGWAKFARTGAEPRGQAAERAGVSVLEVDGASAEVFGRVVVEGFSGVPLDCVDWFAALVARPSWRCFLAMREGEAAGCGAMYARDGAAWLGMEATLAAHRGRGVQGAIIDAQLKAATAAGAAVQTSETAQPAHPDEPGFSSFRNQGRGGLSQLYTRSNFKRAS